VHAQLPLTEGTFSYRTTDPSGTGEKRRQYLIGSRDPAARSHPHAHAGMQGTSPSSFYRLAIGAPQRFVAMARVRSVLHAFVCGQIDARRALLTVAVTMEDIYPGNGDSRALRCAVEGAWRGRVTRTTLRARLAGEKWNFVYGQAHIMDGVGVWSFARLDPAFFEAVC
jgi:hypothetical protein